MNKICNLLKSTGVWTLTTLGKILALCFVSIIAVFLYVVIIYVCLHVAGIINVTVDLYWAIICAGGIVCSKIIPVLLNMVFPDLITVLKK